MREFTDVTLLLDRSGSMRSIKESMESALQEFVSGHQQVPSTRFTLVRFDSQNDQDVVYQNAPISSVEAVKISPRGDTPLLDAFCKTIDNTGARLARMSESTRPDQVLFIVVTDGEENCSRTYRRQDVRDRVTRQANDYRWQFVYLGANQDAFHEASTFGIAPQWSLHYAASAAGTSGASAGLLSNTMNYVQNDSLMRSRSAPEFTTAQRQAADDTPDTV